MEKVFLKGMLLDEFLEILNSFGELHGPTVTPQGVTAFARLTAPSALHLDYSRTQIPPKKYLIPFREEILTYEDGTYLQPAAAPPAIVLFGVHSCDLEGIAYLDQVFMAERPDPPYATKRAALTLIGISCEPDDYCFCTGSGDRAPCDLFLTVREDGYEVAARSEKGQAMMEAAQALFVPASVGPERSCQPCAIPPQDPQLRFSDNPLWEDFANRCVSCGACSVCCPTCYCFDVREYPSLSGGGMRLREWDNCLFVTHGEVSGANFRPTRLDRFRYRFLHKYCGFSPLQGVCSCVGCGRCRKVWPVDIDLREILDPMTLMRKP